MIRKIGLFFSLLMKGGDQIMIDVYVVLIVNKRRNITQVPAQLKDAVLADLTAMGLDGYGEPIPVQTV